MISDAYMPLAAARSGPLTGISNVPGDKSISHRALLFGALAIGTTRISGLLEAQDVLGTARAVSALGAPASKQGDVWVVRGCGVGGLRQPEQALDFGNAGTGVRLMMGVVAGHDMRVTMSGDASLSRRPMARVLTPLRQMGVRVFDQAGQQDDSLERLPLTLAGTTDLIAIEYVLPVPSAQVKTAVLLAGLHARGATTVVEREATRDHTERMLAFFGAGITIEDRSDVEDRGDVGGRGDARAITVTGHSQLTGREIVVPGDPSSAAFLVAAALIVPGSEVTVRGVLVNPTRTGLYQTLREMGADLVFENERDEGGEPVADIKVRYSKLHGVVVPPARAPSMIDEYPVLAVVAAFAKGETAMHGLAELKVKESDRLAATARGLAVNGVQARVDGDSLIVQGADHVPGGGTVETHLDHRIAMAFLTMGFASDKPVRVDDVGIIDTSFPEYRALMSALGAKFVDAAATGAAGEAGQTI